MFFLYGIRDSVQRVQSPCNTKRKSQDPNCAPARNFDSETSINVKRRARRLNDAWRRSCQTLVPIRGPLYEIVKPQLGKPYMWSLIIGKVMSKSGVFCTLEAILPLDVEQIGVSFPVFRGRLVLMVFVFLDLWAHLPLARRSCCARPAHLTSTDTVRLDSVALRAKVTCATEGVELRFLWSGTPGVY